MDIKVRLDRITITGEILWSAKNMAEMLKDTEWEAKDIKKKEYILNRYFEDGGHEMVAVLIKNPHQITYRLDTSNHLNNDKELEDIQKMVGLFREETCHQTRIDIAFDFINGEVNGKPLKPMSHRIYRYNASKAVFYEDKNIEMLGRNQDIETIYSGKRKSELMIRYYNKVSEQKARRKPIPKGIKRWERLELQLRGKKTSEWLKSANQMLGYFKLPELNTIKNTRDRATVYALDNSILSWTELSEGYKTKIRKLIKDNDGFNTEYSKKAISVLKQNQSIILKEIDRFHEQLGIFEYSAENLEKLRNKAS